ncbi:PDR/VanB family oxidoreductase [Nocardia miyunensis]|uniref:PDR/VanB family oxidoreductase n=1 Tax=Nocardia miyunensis TaxID=282684 RepID=UPI000833818B|nr:PDR/VanB family oxidoreductase [Nocardia miyunensis]
MSAHSSESEPTAALLVSRRASLTSEVILLELRHPEGRELPAWSPGSHIDLLLPDEMVRQYSLCGDPADATTWTVAVFLEPEGRGGSAYIHRSLQEGTTVRTRGPRNHFAFGSGKRVLFIGGGIGITPLIPMMAEATERGLDWELHYGGRSRTTMAFADDLLTRFGSDRVHLIPQDERGLIDLETLIGTPRTDTTIYCCGPAPLLDAVETRCAAWPTDALHIERFTAKAVDDDQNTSFEIELSATGVTLTVPQDRSILDVLDDQDVPVPSSCRDGTCGTCETMVLEGVPEHRDSVLSPSEQESNETMMVCVSRSRTPRLVLDL